MVYRWLHINLAGHELPRHQGPGEYKILTCSDLHLNDSIKIWKGLHRILEYYKTET